MWRIIQDQPICINAPDENGVLAEAEDPSLSQLADVTGKAPKSTTPN